MARLLLFRLLLLIGFFLLSVTVQAEELLVEAESFERHGGWKLDTQFIDTMGSPYLLAHGLGRPVTDATTSIQFPGAGNYHVWVRTRDWVARWNAPGAPGKFQLLVNGVPLKTQFGTKSSEWFWHYGGVVTIKDPESKLALKDLTGFEGRCDAIYFSTEKNEPPNANETLAGWRRKQLNLPPNPIEESGYDLVVVGGGYSGLGAAISAARSGCKVALIQNRPVLGGNGSSEVRVWAQGLIRRGKYPRIGEIIEEICDHATKSPGTYEEFEDEKKEKIVRAEKNIDLFLNHHAFQVETEKQEDGSAQVTAVHAFDTRSSAVKRFTGKLFLDATGHGTIGFLAQADWEMTPKGRMGMSNMWAWDEADQPRSFPKTPWALDLNMKDFPYPRDHHGQWFWESGFDKDPLGDAEGIRDWNFRAVYGAFNAMKNRDGAAKHQNAYLTWMAYIGGPRESRRLLGDIVLTQEDVINKKEFKDGCVPSTWSIDLHYPKKQFAEKYPDNPFISIAVHDRRIDRAYGYPVPYRCFYSRNVSNLFMAGRCISVTHEALGTTRVMKTCGMMGEVVGRAASICVQKECLPRDVYQRYWDEMEQLLQLPGKAYRSSVSEKFVVPEDSMQLATSRGPMIGLNPGKLRGIVIDDAQAKKTGKWTKGTGLKPFVAWGYQYAAETPEGQSPATITFPAKMKQGGRFHLGYAFQPHPNRGTAVKLQIQFQRSGEKVTEQVTVDLSQPPEPKGKLDKGFHFLKTIEIDANSQLVVTANSTQAGGLLHADAVQLIPAQVKQTP